MHYILMQDSPKQTENVQSTYTALSYLLKTWPDQTLDCKSVLQERWKQSGHSLQNGKKWQENHPVPSPQLSRWYCCIAYAVSD